MSGCACVSMKRLNMCECLSVCGSMFVLVLVCVKQKVTEDNVCKRQTVPGEKAWGLRYPPLHSRREQGGKERSRKVLHTLSSGHARPLQPPSLTPNP